jgi:hypothetical protein
MRLEPCGQAAAIQAAAIRASWFETRFALLTMRIKRIKSRRAKAPGFFVRRRVRRVASFASLPSRTMRARGTPGLAWHLRHRTHGPRRLAATRQAEVRTASPPKPGVPRAVFEACSAVTPVGRQFFTHR